MVQLIAEHDADAPCDEGISVHTRHICGPSRWTQVRSRESVDFVYEMMHSMS